RQASADEAARAPKSEGVSSGHDSTETDGNHAAAELPGGGGGLALAARRALHRDHRALQPPDQTADGQDRPDEGAGVDRQGGAALEHGEAVDAQRQGRRIAGAGGSRGSCGSWWSTSREHSWTTWTA